MTQKTILTALLAMMGGTMAWANDGELGRHQIYGTLVYSDDLATELEGIQYGIYSFDGEDLTPIVTDYYLAAMGGGTYVNGVYCWNYNFSFMGSMAQNLYLMYDFVSDQITGWQLYETSYADVATQVAYDETSGRVYGQFYNRDRSGRVWGTRDIAYGETEAIRPMVAQDLCALAFDDLGRAWAVDAAGDLLQIDKLTGQYTVVGNTGLRLAKTTQQSGAIDPWTGGFYMFAVLEDNGSALYTIDLATAVASKVADMPNNEQITGAYFLPLSYAHEVPGAATEMRLSMEGAALEGQLTCVAPAVAEDGSVLTEGALLTVTVDGVSVAEIQTTPGQEVTVEVKVERAGTHIVQVIASNGYGKGRAATLHQWIGLDVPTEVRDLACYNTDNNHALLSWTAPTTGLHGGYIDTARLRYLVLDSEGEIVAQDLSETQCEVGKTGSRLTARTYTVMALSGSEAGLSSTSNRVYFGNRYKVPYSTYFDTRAEFDLWYVLDANDDGSTWTYEEYNRYAHYTYNKYNRADDWLFSAPIHLKGEQYYDLQSNMAAEMTYYKERLEIMVCSAQNPDSVVAVARTATETEKDGKEERGFYTYDDTFYVPAEGDYYLAYHCISDANQLRLELRNIELTLGASFDAPAAAENAVFRPGSMGSTSGSVEFDAPTRSIRGDELTSLTKAELYNGKTLAATLTDIEPGMHYTLVDGSAPRGYNDYRLVIYNEHGKGLPVTGTVYVGIDTPAMPQNVKIWLEGDDVMMSWDPVTTGEHGGYIDPSKIEYWAVRQQDVQVVYSGTETHCKDNTLPNHGAQTTYYYGIFAYYGLTPGQGAPTDDVIMGTAYGMPFEEDFSGNSGQSTLWLIGYDPYNTLGMTWSVGELPSYDDNLGNLTCSAYYEDGGFHFVSSGKIQVDGKAKRPVLTFPYLCPGMEDRIDVVISTQGVPNQGEIVATLKPQTTSDWNMAQIDLSAYKGEQIIVTWRCYLAEAGDLVLDDVRVYDDQEAGIECVEMDSDRGSSVPLYDLQGRQLKTEPGKAAEGFRLSPSSKHMIVGKR